VAFEEIKEYLSTPPVLKALRSEVSFQLYVAAKDDAFGVVLTQEIKGNEHSITYVSQ
jgi:hypothetical protein